MLDRLTVASFTPAIGDTFALRDEDAPALDLELVEARTHDPGAEPVDPSGARAPFTLVFRGASQPVLRQRIYRLEHDTVGALAIFLVPIGRDGAGTRYEAIFT